jgi:hypothetical protein
MIAQPQGPESKDQLQQQQPREVEQLPYLDFSQRGHAPLKAIRAKR